MHLSDGDILVNIFKGFMCLSDFDMGHIWTWLNQSLSKMQLLLVTMVSAESVSKCKVGWTDIF